MKTKITLLTIITCIILLSGCSKDEPVIDPIDQTVKNLTGSGNRRWFLRKMYINGVPVSLTDYELQYWKDYTINTANPYNSTFADRDGYQGSIRINNVREFKETPTNASRVTKFYDINFLSATEMDVEYPANGTITREIYHAN